jgi:hypothetical protein
MDVMRTNRVNRIFAMVTAAAGCVAVAPSAEVQSISPTKARPIAIDASIYGYSRNTTQVKLAQTGNAPKAESLRGPPSQFVNVPRRSGAAFRDG